MNRINTFRVVVGSLVLAVASLALAQTSKPEQVTPSDTLVYVGTYTGGTSASKGIYVFKLQTSGLEVSQNITLVPLGLAAEAANPSFIEIDAKRRLLFAVNEDAKGMVSSFSIGGDGRLTLINEVSSKGAGPCHLVLDKDGRHLIVSNYNDGSVAVIPVGSDGKLGETSDVKKHSGKSVDPKRQEGPHAHCATL